MRKNEKKLGSYERLVQRLRRNSPKIKLNGKEYTKADIYDNSNLKKLLVDEHPDLAHQFYLQWEDEELGRIFVNTYNGHPDYGEQAAHIANELGILGIVVPFSQVRKNVSDFEESEFKISQWSRCKSKQRHYRDFEESKFKEVDKRQGERVIY